MMRCFRFFILMLFLGQPHLVRGTPDLDGFSKRQEQLVNDTTLPYEIIQEIFSYLPLKTLSKARQVCKAWDAALDKRFFWRQYFDEELNANDLYYPPWSQLSDQALKQKLIDRILEILTRPEAMMNHHQTLVKILKSKAELPPNAPLSYNIQRLAKLGVSWAKVAHVRQVSRLSYQYQYLCAKYTGEPWALQEVCLDAVKDCWVSDPTGKVISGHLPDDQGSLLAAFPRYWGISVDLDKWLLDFYSTYASLSTLKRLFTKVTPKRYENHKHRGLGFLAWAFVEYDLMSAGNRLIYECSSTTLTQYLAQEKARKPEKRPLFALLEKVRETKPGLDKLQDDAFMYNFLKANAPQKATSDIYMELYAQFCARRFLRYEALWTNLGRYVQLFRDLR